VIGEDSEKWETRTTISNIVEVILENQKSIIVFNVNAVGTREELNRSIRKRQIMRREAWRERAKRRLV